MSFFGTSGGNSTIAITDTYVVGSQAAMLALGANKGDVAVRTDLNKTFILAGTDPTVLGDWQELLTPTDSVTSVNGDTGVVVLDSADIAENTNLYFTEGRVLGTDLAGFVSGAGTVTAADTILSAIDKLDGNTSSKAPLASPSFTGDVGINIATTQDPVASFQIDSTTKGVLIPRMTKTQRDAISSPPVGLMIFNADASRLEIKHTIGWLDAVTAGITSGGANGTSVIIGNGTPLVTAQAQNVIIGNGAGAAYTSAGSVIIGQFASNVQTGGSSNTIVGSNAALQNTTGASNTYIGSGAGRNWTGSNNVWLGAQSTAVTASAAASNVIVGQGSSANLTGSFNTFLGRSTATGATSATRSILIGYLAGTTGPRFNTGSDNIQIFCGAGSNVDYTGNNNILLGALTLPSTTDSNQINLGDHLIGNATNIALKSPRTFTIESNTASRALISDASKNVVHSTVTQTELELLSGKTALGDVVGPASSTDNAIARFDSTTGKLLQNSINTLDDTGRYSVVIPSGTTPGMTIDTGLLNMVSYRSIWNGTDVFSVNTGGTAGVGIINVNRPGGAVGNCYGINAAISGGSGTTYGPFAGNGTYGGYFRNDVSGTAGLGGVGVFGMSTNSDNIVGVMGVTNNPGTVSAKAFAVCGYAALNGNETSFAGGYFRLGLNSSSMVNSLPTGVTSALIADNGNTTNDIFLAQDNSSTIFKIADGGAVTVSSLTASKLVVTDGSKVLISSSLGESDLTDMRTPPSARAHDSSITVGSGAVTVVWDVEDFDTASAFASTTTGIFTAPSAGKYLVNASIGIQGTTFVGTDDQFITIKKNGSTVCQNIVRTALAKFQLHISDLVSCAANDTIEIELTVTGTSPLISASTGQNCVSIIKMSN